LLINGSPHKEGCTYTALCKAAAALNQVSIPKFSGLAANLLDSDAVRTVSEELADRIAEIEAWMELSAKSDY